MLISLILIGLFSFVWPVFYVKLHSRSFQRGIQKDFAEIHKSINSISLRFDAHKTDLTNPKSNLSRLKSALDAALVEEENKRK